MHFACSEMRFLAKYQFSFFAQLSLRFVCETMGMQHRIFTEGLDKFLMAKTPKRLQQKSWDAINAKYASLDSPEWVIWSRLPAYFWDDEENHKRYIKWLAKELGISKLEDWYQITSRDFTSRRGYGFLEYYEHSAFVALKKHFPKYDWKPWLFPQAPSGYWHDLNNCFTYVRWFEKQKEFRSIEGWYSITQDDVYDLHGSGLMDHFDCSVQRLITAVYPDHDWKPWLFVQVPKNFWPHKKNRVAYMKWLENKLGYSSPEDWYSVSKLDFIRNQGASLMQFGYKTVELIRELYPNRKWHPWMFKQVYQGYWRKKAHRLEYLDWFAAEVGFKTEEDWLELKRRHFVENFGSTLFDDYYKRDPLRVLKEIYPKTKHVPWEFHQVPVGFWDEVKNCRSYLTWLGKRLGFKSRTDWYEVRRSDFRENAGNGFIKRFKTPFFGLKAAYPKYNWLPWMFENVPVGFWQDERNCCWYLNWLGKRLKFKSRDQWLKLTAVQLRENRGNGLIAKHSVKNIRELGASLVQPELQTQ